MRRQQGLPHHRPDLGDRPNGQSATIDAAAGLTDVLGSWTQGATRLAITTLVVRPAAAPVSAKSTLAAGREPEDRPSRPQSKGRDPWSVDVR